LLEEDEWTFKRFMKNCVKLAFAKLKLILAESGWAEAKDT
tara:strand:+ start:1622 stop:1741 length:120 start_codon:yes stop_codon:yes gene_type:complete